MRVDVYRNLNRRDGVWYSIRYEGKVQEYARYVLLKNCSFKHATNEQLAAVRSGPRGGCQWIKGDRDLVMLEPTDVEWKDMVCDPKRFDGFCDSETGEQLGDVDWVRLWENGRAQYAVVAV